MKILLLFLSISLFANNKNHILYLMKNEKYQEAIASYQKYFKDEDFDTLRKMVIIFLNKGVNSKKKEIKKRALFGAGLCQSSKCIDLLEKGILSSDLTCQMLTLHFLANFQNNKADELILKASKSRFLETRVKALYILALKKHPLALKELFTIKNILPDQFKPFFSQILGIIGTNEAIKILKNFLSDSNMNVRTSAILSICSNKRDDLLDFIRKKIEHGSIAEKEAAIYTLGEFQDSSCLEKIKKQTLSKIENIKLASCISLFKLKEKSAFSFFAKPPLNTNLFAINFMQKIDELENVLIKNLNSKDLQIKMNSSISLLQRKNSLSLKILKDIFKNYHVKPIYSIGQTQTAFHFYQSEKVEKELLQASLSIKDFFLKEIFEMEENHFLSFSDFIFENNIKQNISSICQKLENRKNENIIKFLKEKSIKIGAPLIRAYANLSLFKMEKKNGDYIKKFVQENYFDNKSHIKPFSSIKISKNPFTITKEEHSHLFLEILNTFSNKKNIDSITFLIKIWEKANILDKYIISGFLLNALE